MEKTDQKGGSHPCGTCSLSGHFRKEKKKNFENTGNISAEWLANFFLLLLCDHEFDSAIFFMFVLITVINPLVAHYDTLKLKVRAI